MTNASWGFLGAAALVALVDWAAVARRHKPLEYAAKPGTLVLLIATALALTPDDGGQRAWFVAALVLSLAGDVFLMLPSDRFVAGLASFLLGHVAFVVGFALEQDSPAGVATGAAAAVVASATIGRRLLAAAGPKLRGPVAAYMAAIGAMVVTAFGTGDAPAVTGAVLFYTSDGMIAWNRFVAPFPYAKVLIIVTYHVAQAALVLSLTA